MLQTQLDERDPIASWAHSMNLLSQQLKASDPDIRRLLNQAPGDLNVVKKFVQNNRTDLGVTLANLATVGTLLVRHLNGIEEVFELYPALAAGGQSVITSDQVGQLGLVLDTTPRDCGDPTKGSEGYEGTILRNPSDLVAGRPERRGALHRAGEQRHERARLGERARRRSDQHFRRRRGLSSRHHAEHHSCRHPARLGRRPWRQGLARHPGLVPALTGDGDRRRRSCPSRTVPKATRRGSLPASWCWSPPC